MNGANLISGRKNSIKLKLKALDIIDYGLSLKDEELTDEFSGSRLWVILTDLLKWSASSTKKARIRNIFQVRSKEDKKLTVEFRDKLNACVKKWAELYPLDHNARQSVFSHALEKFEGDMELNSSRLSNPLKKKVIKFDPVSTDFDQTLPASTYFAIILSVSRGSDDRCTTRSRSSSRKPSPGLRSSSRRSRSCSGTWIKSSSAQRTR